MQNDISNKIMKADHMLQSFINDPKGNNTNYLLGSTLDCIDDIDISRLNIPKFEYNKLRLSLLILHLKICLNLINIKFQIINPKIITALTYYHRKVQQMVQLWGL